MIMGYMHTLFIKKKLLKRGLLGIVILFVCLILAVYIISFLLGPPPLSNDQNTIYFAQNGDVIGEEKGAESRYWVDLDDMSPHIIDATLAVEDQNFYHHRGFDPKGITRALLLNVKNLSLKEGASTLTQQYARNLYLNHEKTWSRKLKEAFYTIRLEMFYDKDDILEGYLNTIYFGHGAYGVEAASRHFFNKHANELTISEAAMLAGIPKGPTYYSPLNDKERAEARQERTLHLMHAQDKISKTDLENAQQETLTYDNGLQKDDKRAAHFQDTILEAAADILSLDKASIQSGGYHIHTTINTDRQAQLHSEVNEEIDTSSDIEIGAIAMKPQTGAIEALIGGRDYDHSTFNRATKAKRMPGSAFKPFLYYTALEHNYTASTTLMSQPTTFKIAHNNSYQPSNFNDYYADAPITLAQALPLSDNIYAVKTGLFVGIDQLIETAQKIGITSDLPEVPSLALGTASVSVEEMVTAYSMLANGGLNIEPHIITKITDSDGRVVFERQKNQPDQILNPTHTFILTHLLTGMFNDQLNGYMSVTGSTIADQLTRTYAGKSGTTSSDSWMIGYSPSLVTGIWTGYDDNRTLDSVGETTYAKNIWAGFMETAHENKPAETFDVPPTVVAVKIDPQTGDIATPYCDRAVLMYYERGTEPTSHCTAHFPTDRNKGKHIVKERQEKRGFLERLFDLFH